MYTGLSVPSSRAVRWVFAQCGVESWADGRLEQNSIFAVGFVAEDWTFNYAQLFCSCVRSVCSDSAVARGVVESRHNNDAFVSSGNLEVQGLFHDVPKRSRKQVTTCGSKVVPKSRLASGAQTRVVEKRVTVFGGQDILKIEMFFICFSFELFLFHIVAVMICLHLVRELFFFFAMSCEHMFGSRFGDFLTTSQPHDATTC